MTAMVTNELSLLRIVQEFCKRKALPQPISVVGSQDDTILQIWGLLNEGIQDICDRYDFQELKTAYNFNHAGTFSANPATIGYVGQTDNYKALDWSLNQSNFVTPNLFRADIRYMIPDTLWDLTNRRKVVGPLSQSEWQQLTTMLISQALYSYRIQNNALYIYPVPTTLTSVTFSFWYQSRFGVSDNTVASPDTTTAAYAAAENFFSDSSAPRIPTRIVLADLKWRWAKEKSLPYAEDQRICEAMIVNHIGRGTQEGTLVMDGASDAFAPLILVPAGSWNL